MSAPPACAVSDNAFVAALLASAAAHRARAEQFRSHITGLPVHSGWLCWPSMDPYWERDAREQEGLAEVYESFAERAWRLP